MVNSLNVSAVVLRKADYRDYDRMLTLLTAENGIVEAVARGCRRTKSELMNAAEPFVCGQYQLYFTHGRYTVTQCKVTDGFYPLRTDFDRLTVGAKWLKMVENACVADVPAGEIFDTLLSALSYLTYSELEINLLDAMFKMKLCYHLGIAPMCLACTVCGVGHERETLYFDAAKGGCVCKKCAPNATPLSEGARRILQKAPRTPYKSVELLATHPDRQEAHARITDYIEKQLK